MTTTTTIKNAAERFGVPYPTFLRWVNLSGTPTVRMGNYRLIDVQTAVQLVASKKRKKATTA